MARSSGIKEAVRKAKAEKKKHPRKYDHLKKKDRWSKGYMKHAFATVSAAPSRRKPARKPAKRKKVGAVKKKKKAPRKTARKKSTAGLRLVKNVTKSTTERVMAGRKRRKRKAGSIGTAYRRSRSVGRSGSNTGLILGVVGLGVIALLLSQTATTAQYQNQTFPPLQQTQSYTRNQQSNDLVNYAIAAGLAANAIADLINRLNRSDDNEVGNIYDHVNTTGDIGAWV